MSVDFLLRSFKTLGDLEHRQLCPPFDSMDRNELAVVRWLLWRYNDQGGKCNPSDADIAAGTGLSDRVIRRARTSLRQRYLLSWEEGRSGGKRASNAYDLTAIWAACVDLSADMADLPAKNVRATGQNAQELPAVSAEEKKGLEAKGEEENELKPVADAPGLSQDFNEERKQQRQAALEQQREADRRSDEEALADLEAQLATTRYPDHTQRAIDSLREKLGGVEATTSSDSQELQAGDDGASELSAEQEADLERIAEKVGQPL